MVTLRKLRFEDVKDLSCWGRHEDIRYTHYDFRDFNERDFKYWFKSKQKPPFRYIYGIVDRGSVVGFVTMKNINWLTRCAAFGLVVDPSKLNQGYGKEGLSQFMALFFETFKMKTLHLKVSDFNERAKKVYESLGFQTIQFSLSPFEDQTRNFELVLETHDFKMRSHLLCTQTHTMQMTQKEYFEKKNEG